MVVKKLVIIGNGLDKHHGINSSYQDFYKSDYLDNVLRGKYNVLREKLYNGQNEKIIDTWFDFEEEYRQLIYMETKNAENGKYNTGQLAPVAEKNFPIFEHQIENINLVFKNIKESFVKYLKDEYELSKTREKFINDKVVEDELKQADKIINFNYTSTLEDLYNIEGSKIIFPHGTLKTYTILGHSNYFNKEYRYANYSFEVNIPKMRGTAFVGDKTLQRLEQWNDMKFEDAFIEEDMGTFDLQNRLNKINKINCKYIGNKNPMSMNILEYAFNNPFSSWCDKKYNFSYKNLLNLDFSKKIEIVVIGHGLGSDNDLLSKIPVNNKTVKLFVRSNSNNKDLRERAKKTFHVWDYYIDDIFYSWD